MAKQVASFRLDEEVLEGADQFAAFLNVPRASLVEDALRQAVIIYNSAAVNRNSMWEELHRRYGSDAELVVWVTGAEDGHGEAHVRIDGKQPEDVTAQLSVETEAAIAHIFLDVEGWSFERFGSTRIGPTVMLTMPLLSAAQVPWPPKQDQPLAVKTRLGDIVKPRNPVDEVVTVP